VHQPSCSKIENFLRVGGDGRRREASGEFITESADKIGAVIEILFIIKKG
jgi:hypothetical protein